MEFRNEARSYQIFGMDLWRAWMVLFLAVWTIERALPQWRPEMATIRLIGVWPLVFASLVILHRRKRRIMVAAHRLAGAASGPLNAALPPRNFHCAGLAYYDREQPAMFVRRGNFYAINLAHPRSQLLLAYLGGWAVLGAFAWRLA